MYLSDYHIHTHLSMDCTEKTQDMVNAASKMGLSEIAICDHCDLNLMEQFPYSSAECFEDYTACKNMGVKIKIGVEMGQQTEFPKLSKEILSFDKYDFVIGSYHCMQGYPDFSEADYKNYDVPSFYDTYFEGLLDYAKNADFDIMGHITYPFRYGFRQGYTISIADYMDATEKVLKALIERGKGLEANTSGLRDSMNSTHPPIFVLKRYLELGGEHITVGSDAHHPSQVGFMIKETYKALKDAGFNYITSYTSRIPQNIKID